MSARLSAVRNWRSKSKAACDGGSVPVSAHLTEDSTTEGDHSAGSRGGTTQHSAEQSCPSVGCSLPRLLVEETLDVKLHRPALLFRTILQAALDAPR